MRFPAVQIAAKGAPQYCCKCRDLSKMLVKAPRRPSKLNDPQRKAIARMIDSGPTSAINGVARWRLVDLAQWIFETDIAWMVPRGCGRRGLLPAR